MSNIYPDYEFNDKDFTSFTHFGMKYKDIRSHVSNPENYKLIRESGYFRDYAFKNDFELIAVILEYFFETPQEFKQRFPILYKMVEEMLNVKEVCFKP